MSERIKNEKKSPEEEEKERNIPEEYKSDTLSGSLKYLKRAKSKYEGALRELN